MITSFRDNALKKLGLDYEAVHARHPHSSGRRCAAMGNTVLSATARDSTPRPTVRAAASSPRCRKPITSSHQLAGSDRGLERLDGPYRRRARCSRAQGPHRGGRQGDGEPVHCALWAMQIMLASTQFGDKWPKSRYNVTCRRTTPTAPRTMCGS